VDFILVSIELFSSGVMADVLRANIGSKLAISFQRGPVDPKFQVEEVAPTNHSSSQKSRLNDLSYGIKIWTDLSSVLLQFTCLTDRRTDRQTPFSSLDRVCIPCCAVKIVCYYTKIFMVNTERQTDRHDHVVKKSYTSTKNNSQHVGT